jgi:lambda family phage portal protein
MFISCRAIKEDTMGRHKRNEQKARTVQKYPTASGVITAKNSGYGDFAASRVRKSFQGFRATSLSPHRDIVQHTDTLRSRSRSLYMSAPVATAAIKTLRTSVVGRGLHLHVKADYEDLGITKEQAAEWGRNVEKEFEMWAANPAAADIRGQHDFYELQQLALVSWKMSGDAFCLFRQGKPTMFNPHTLRLQLLEADRISTEGSLTYNAALNYAEAKNGNRVYDGVEVDKNTGAIVAYYISSDYPKEGTNMEWTRVEKYGSITGLPNILHLMDAERPEQLRGVPFITPVMETIMQLARYLQAESMAALLETCYSGYITSEVVDSPITAAPMAGGVDGEEETEEIERDLNALAPEPGGGMFQLLPGENITFNDPKRPGTQFEPFTSCLAKYIGTALEIPADVLLKSYNSSYSASRAAMQDFWRMVEMTRDWFASDFCGQVYAEWLTEAVATGRIEAPGFFTDPRRRMAWLGHEWTGHAMPHLDPVKEANAMKIMTENGWLTHKQATTKLNGGDWEKNIEEAQHEAEKMAVVHGLLNAALQVKQQESNTENEETEENEQTEDNE